MTFEGGRLTRREQVLDDEMAALAALVLGGAALVPGVIAAGPAGLLVGVAAAASTFGVTEIRRWLRRDGPLALEHRRQRRRAGAVRSIGRARPGLRRVRGRVKVLEPVELDVACAAWWTRRLCVERRFDGLSRSGRPVHVYEERQACGRLAVVDETGVAIVAADRVRLACASVFLPFGPKGGALRVDDGDAVEVIGRARRARAPDAVRVGRTGYRDPGSTLLFDDSPLVVLLEPRFSR